MRMGWQVAALREWSVSWVSASKAALTGWQEVGSCYSWPGGAKRRRCDGPSLEEPYDVPTRMLIHHRKLAPMHYMYLQ
jgi:hypothetical protein